MLVGVGVAAYLAWKAYRAVTNPGETLAAIGDAAATAVDKTASAVDQRGTGSVLGGAQTVVADVWRGIEDFSFKDLFK